MSSKAIRRSRRVGADHVRRGAVPKPVSGGQPSDLDGDWRILPPGHRRSRWSFTSGTHRRASRRAWTTGPEREEAPASSAKRSDSALSIEWKALVAASKARLQTIGAPSKER